MQIEYYKDVGLRLYFPKIELKVALSILKAIYSIQKLSFVKAAIDDLERDLQPSPPVSSHFHFCEECKCEIDDRVGDNFIHYKNGENERWTHHVCPKLKETRPV